MAGTMAIQLLPLEKLCEKGDDDASFHELTAMNFFILLATSVANLIL
jgi:hypothetical protein